MKFVAQLVDIRQRLQIRPQVYLALGQPAVEFFHEGWEFTTEILLTTQPGIRNPTTAEEWEIGFVQNVLQVEAAFQYSSGTGLRFLLPTADRGRRRVPILDAKNNPPWVNSLPPPSGQPPCMRRVTIDPAAVSYARSNRRSLETIKCVDYPRTKYFLFENGGMAAGGGRWVTSIEVKTRFQAFIIARRVSAPLNPTVVRSSRIWETNDVYTSTGLPAPRSGSRQIADTSTTNIAWPNPSPRATPRLDGDAANVVLVNELVTRGVSPRFDWNPWP